MLRIITIFLWIASANAQVLVFEESFDSQTLNSTVSGWTYEPGNTWKVVEDSTLDSSAPHHAFGTTSSQQNVGVPLSSVVSLTSPGDALQVEFQYRYVTPPASPGLQPFNFFRFGLYNSNGTASVFQDDVGYLADVSYWSGTGSGPKSGDFSIRSEQNVFPSFNMGILLDNKSAIDSGPPAIPETGDILTLANSARVLEGEDGTGVHEAVLRVTMHSTGPELELFWDGDLEASTGAISGLILSSFDTIYFEAPSDNSGFLVDSIKVAVVPESRTVALVAVSLLLGIFITAKRRLCGFLP
jgi:hypothetical protein